MKSILKLMGYDWKRGRSQRKIRVGLPMQTTQDARGPKINSWPLEPLYVKAGSIYLMFTVIIKKKCC